MDLNTLKFWEQKLESPKQDEVKKSKRQEADEELQRCIKVVCSTHEGKQFLHHVMLLSGFKRGDDPLEPLAMACNLGRRRLYLEIRELIPTQYRNEIEKDIEDVNDTTDPTTSNIDPRTTDTPGYVGKYGKSIH